MQVEHIYPMKSDAPFAVIPGGLARFDAEPANTPATGRITAEVRWHLRDVATGQEIRATLRAASDHEALYGELATDVPLCDGKVYQTLSVSAPASDRLQDAQTPQTTSRHRLGLARGTRVMTARGEMPVEKLQAGDRVITRDHGMQEVRYVGRQDITVSSANAPVWIREGALKNARDLILSADTRVVIKGTQALARYGAKEVLVPARDLVDGTNYQQGVGGTVSFYQIVTDRHEVIYAEAAAVESFMADEAGLTALDAGNREAMMAALPCAPDSYGPSARRYIDPRG